LAVLLLNAQSTTDDKSKDSGKEINIQGCLVKGDQPDSYQIKGADMTYMLVGKKQDLDKHVGHQVSISGARSEDKIPGAPADAVVIKVSTLSKISDSCQ